MKHPRLLCTILICLSVLLGLGAALGEGAPYRFFPEKTWCRVTCEVPGLVYDVAFYPDGHLDGAEAEGMEILGCYVIRSDGTLQIDTNVGICELQLQADGSYAGTSVEGEGTGIGTLTRITEKDYQQTMRAAGIDLPGVDERPDVMFYDYPMFVQVTAPEGMALYVHPLWTDDEAAVLPKGTVARILGNTENGESYLEAGSIRGFTASEDYDELRPGHAKVVRAGKEKGKSVNLRAAPEYADNIIMEVRYGETVDTFPLVQGEFTLVYYDHAEGWMTTVRLKPIKEKK